MRLASICIVVIALLASGAFALRAAPNMVANPGFESRLDQWTAWGTQAAFIALDSTTAHSGKNSARIGAGHNALYFRTPMQAGEAYEIRFFYRLGGPNPSGQVDLSFFANGGIRRSAGFTLLRILPAKVKSSSGWTEMKQVFMPSDATVSSQIAFSADGQSTLWLDDVSLRVVPRPKGLQPLPEPWGGLKHRTANPLFNQLLSSEPGGYTVTSWTHNLNRANLPEALRDSFPDDATWEKQLEKTYTESAANGLGYLDLPGGIAGTSTTRTAEFHRELNRLYGVKFDVWTEGSASISAAVTNGAEVLNPSAVAKGGKPGVSLVDPKYVEAQEKILVELAGRLRGEPFVNMYYGKDEPSVHIPEGKAEQWGGYGRQMADEVVNGYGFGKFAAPTPKEPGFDSDPNKPLRWIAYNRWAADKFCETRARLAKALHAVDPKAVYSPADHWFMSGFVPHDLPKMASFTDLFDIDPYASSAERKRGRGVYNHGFGPKFVSDLTGKPVRSIVQAFDYAGYTMNPEDLREWVSQSLRCGAAHINYYTMDNPQYNAPDRWKMMLHLSKVITTMNRVALPADPDTAILYASYTHMSQGASTGADQLYTAHALVGEMAGSWYRFIADTQLERGERDFKGCKVVYLPLGKYMTPEATAKIEDYVRGGGVLVCGDAEAFSRDLQGNDTSAARERILGIRLGAPKTAAKLLLTPNFADGARSGLALPLFDIELWGRKSRGRARSIAVVDKSAVVIGTYPEGFPAIVKRKLGKGLVITFAANPFAPEVCVEKTQWPSVFKAMQKGFGCKVDRTIWRFALPPIPKAAQ